MSKIAALAREAQGEFDRQEDQQVAVEIKLAAECLLESHRSPAPRKSKPETFSHHD